MVRYRTILASLGLVDTAYLPCLATSAKAQPSGQLRNRRRGTNFALWPRSILVWSSADY